MDEEVSRRMFSKVKLVCSKGAKASTFHRGLSDFRRQASVKIRRRNKEIKIKQIFFIGGTLIDVSSLNYS